LQQVIDTYPLPQHLSTLNLQYRLTKTGEVMVHRERENPETGKKDWIPIASPFGITARLRYATDNAYGLRCVVQGMNGRPSVIDFDRGGLAKLGASEIRAMLFEAGLRTEGDGEQVAVQVLKAANPEREILAVRRPGWHEIAGHPAPFFITPKGVVIAGPDGIELVATARLIPEVAGGRTLHR